MPQRIFGAHPCRNRSTEVRCGGGESANVWRVVTGMTAAGGSVTASAVAPAEADRLNTTIPRAASPIREPAKNRIGLNQFANAALIKTAAVNMSEAVKPSR